MQQNFFTTRSWSHAQNWKKVYYIVIENICSAYNPMHVVVFYKHVLILQESNSNFLTLKVAWYLNDNWTRITSVGILSPQMGLNILCPHLFYHSFIKQESKIGYPWDSIWDHLDWEPAVIATTLRSNTNEVLK